MRQQKSGRIARAYLEEQPDDAVPRFQYEDHLKALIDERIWPDLFDAGNLRTASDDRISKFASMWNRMFSGGKLSVDIVDYPGEWLLDLPLLGKTYAEFSRDSLQLAELAKATAIFVQRTGSRCRPTPRRMRTQMK